MSKKANNEGTIYRTADGRWRSSISLGWHEGKPKRKYFSGDTRAQVQELLTDAQHANKRDLPVAPERMTVAQFLERWLRESVKGSSSYNTHASYARLAKKHLVPDLGRIKLEKLSPLDVQSFVTRKLESGLSPRSVQYLHAILRAALEQATKWGLVIRNVAKLVDAPAPRRKQVPYFTPEQARLFQRAIEGHRLMTLFLVAIMTGLRQGELLGLLWEDLAGECLSIRRSLQRIDGVLKLVDTKTDRSRRMIVLPELVSEALAAHRIAQEKERCWAGSSWKESGLMFTSKIGTPLDGTNVTKQFQALLVVANLPRCRFHDLRHTCATLMLSQGVHARTVMEQLGHSQIGLTMNTYGHVIPAMSRDAADKVNAIFTPPTRTSGRARTH